MALSGTSIETLMELLEAKLGCVEIFDREDAREVKNLERCRVELQAYRPKRGPAPGLRAQGKKSAINTAAGPI